MKTKEHKDLKRAKKEGASKKHVCDKYCNFLKTHSVVGLDTSSCQAWLGISSFNLTVNINGADISMDPVGLWWNTPVLFKWALHTLLKS